MEYFEFEIEWIDEVEVRSRWPRPLPRGRLGRSNPFCCLIRLQIVSITTELVITADVFEEGSGVPSSLQHLGAQVAIELLPAGDYRIDGGVLVERKTVADLHGSLARGRFWSQVGHVRDTAVLPFLFVEGDELDQGPRHPNAIRSCLLAILAA